MTTAVPDDSIPVAGAPALPGLRFRQCRGRDDYPAMVAVCNASNAADGIEWTASLATFAQQYAALTGSDVRRDVLVVELDHQIVGYSRVECWPDQDGRRTYVQSGYLLPAWRDRGIERAVLRHNEGHARALAAAARGGAGALGAVAATPSRAALLQQEGYAVAWHDYVLVRPHLDDIPALPLPEGLRVRPVEPAHLPAIWAAEVEAFAGRAARAAHDADEFARWQQELYFQPALWQVAWAGSEVAGMIRSYINPDENAAYGRRRGYTEHISVRPRWRRRGLARALLARSLRLLREEGMTQAALGVNSANQTGALQLYESLGFAIVVCQSFYRKALA
jgi:ribosomal protein S18 acetylase RimI-like enzyme